MFDPHREIQTLVDNFVADLCDLAKRIAIDQLKAAFAAGTQAGTKAGTKAEARAGTRSGPKAETRSGPKTGPKARAKARPKVTAAPAASAPSRPGRARRGQREIEALRSKLLATIAEQPGRRAEDINTALGTNTAQIAQPLRRLVVEQLVRTEGARRGTRYFVVGSADAQNSRRPTVDATAAAVATSAAAVASAANAANAANATSVDEPPA